VKNNKIRYAVIGSLAGLANGLLGAGGGLFVVPLLTRWTKMEPRRAFATSLAVILPLSVASLVIYILRGQVDFSFGWPFLVGGAVGGLAAGLFLKRVPVVWLRCAFGLLIVVGGVRALFKL